MVYGRYNYSFHGVYKPTYNWGAPYGTILCGRESNLARAGTDTPEAWTSSEKPAAKGANVAMGFSGMTGKRYPLVTTNIAIENGDL